MGRKKLSAGQGFRNTFYILAIIWGILSPIAVIASSFIGLPFPFILSLRDWISNTLLASLVGAGGLEVSNVVAAIVIDFVSILPIIGVFSAIRCWKQRRQDSAIASSAGMVVGLIAINPFLIIGGFLNHRVYVKNNKYMPTGAGRLG